MKTLLFRQRVLAAAFSCLIGFLSILNHASAQDKEDSSTAALTTGDGFENLIADGDLSKFRGYQKEQIGPGWKVENGELIFDGTKSGDIITKEKYGSFELQMEWAISPGGNSGVMFHVGLGDNAPYMTGPEIQILDDSKHHDGHSPLTSAAALYGLYAPQEKKLEPVGQWNSSRIVVDGKKVTHFFNGTKVIEAVIGSDDWNARLAKSKFSKWPKFATLDDGFIAFQDHGNAVRFRNIHIKRIGENSASK